MLRNYNERIQCCGCVGDLCATDQKLNLMYLRHQWSDGADTLQFCSTDARRADLPEKGHNGLRELNQLLQTSNWSSITISLGNTNPDHRKPSSQHEQAL